MNSSIFFIGALSLADGAYFSAALVLKSIFPKSSLTSITKALISVSSASLINESNLAPAAELTVT